MISSINNIRSSSFGLGYLTSSVIQKNDLLTLTIDQPIRVELGTLNLDVPIYELNKMFFSIRLILIYNQVVEN